MVSDQLRNGETVAGHRGVLVSGKVRGDQVIDLSKAGFISEAEVLVMPNESLEIEVETFVPLQQLANSAESDEEKLALYRETSNEALKNYIFLNHSNVLESEDINAILEPAMEEYQRSNKSRYDSILNSNSGVSKGEGYIYSRSELNPARRKNLTKFHQYNVITETGNGFVIKENMSTDLSLRRDRSLKTITVDAILPDGLVELFEKGGLLNEQQLELLETIYKGITSDLIKLAKDFEIDTLETRLRDDLGVINVSENTLELSEVLKRNIGRRYNARNEVQRVSSTEQMKKDSAKITDTVLSLINAAIKNEWQSPKPQAQAENKARPPSPKP